MPTRSESALPTWTVWHKQTPQSATSCGCHILCFLLDTLHLYTNMDPKCVSLSTKFGMSRLIGVCNRIGLRYSHSTHYAPRLIERTDNRHRTHETYLKYQSSLVNWCVVWMFCVCNAIWYGVHNECFAYAMQYDMVCIMSVLCMQCNMIWCA